MKYLVGTNESVFLSQWLSKFISYLSGTLLKNRVEGYIYKSFFLIKKTLRISPLFLFFEVLEKIKPAVGLKIYSQRRRKIVKTMAIPFLGSASLFYKRAIFWLYKSIITRKENSLEARINQEFYSVIFNGISNSLIKKKEYYKFAVMFKSAKKFRW